MIKSADIVARSLLNKHHVAVKLGMFTFRMYQPFVKDLARAFAAGRDRCVDTRSAKILSGHNIAAYVPAQVGTEGISMVRQEICLL